MDGNRALGVGKVCSVRNTEHWLVSDVRSAAQILCACVRVSVRESFLQHSPSGKVKASLGDGMKADVKPHQSLRIPNRASYGEAGGSV